MGEISKRSGEHGEEIVEKFLKEIIGYSNIQTNKKIECVYNKIWLSVTHTNSLNNDNILCVSAPLREIGLAKSRRRKDQKGSYLWKTFNN